MQINRILCPTDFSSNSDSAVQFASDLAKANDATIYFLHVAMPAPYGAAHVYAPVETITDELRQQFHNIQPTDPRIPHEHHLLDGHPADVVVQFAKDHGIDLIVIGTHGRTGLSRLLMGSVAEQIVRRAGCPVLAIKQPAGVAASSS